MLDYHLTKRKLCGASISCTPFLLFRFQEPRHDEMCDEASGYEKQEGEEMRILFGTSVLERVRKIVHRAYQMMVDFGLVPRLVVPKPAVCSQCLLHASAYALLRA